jgi:glucose/arabinose dehydrogenase
MRSEVIAVLAAAALLLGGCPAEDEPEAPETPTPEETAEEPDETPDEPEEEPDDPQLTEPPPLDVEEVVSGLDEPTDLTAPEGEDRLYISERHGTVRVVVDGDIPGEPFLDVSDRITSQGQEQGLLSLAFHPEDPVRVFVHYTGTGGETVLAEFAVEDPDRADPDSEQVLFTTDQPAGNHNGGKVVFDPDGNVLLAIGDGGGANDQFEQGQDPTTPLGAIIRLDVTESGEATIPDDNPFADGEDGAEEVWAYGLRNPYRIAVDPDPGLLYIADVGQSDWQSVNVVPVDEGGLNHGWPIVEGSHCFDPPDDCPTDGLVLPAYEYPHAGTPSAIIGGFVYRGDEIPDLQGTYLYSDYGHGFLRSFTYDPETEEVIHQDEHLPPNTLGQVYAFGRDGHGELYVLTADGTVYRVVAAG